MRHMLVAALFAAMPQAGAACAQEHAAHAMAMPQDAADASAPTAAPDAHARHATQTAQARHAVHAPPAPTAAASAAAARHVAPPPPAHPLPGMTHAQMVEAMAMGDDAVHARLLLDQFEHARGDDASAAAWNAQGWIGRDFDKLWFKTEGARRGGQVEDARAELLWDHAFATWWDWQLGARRDFGAGPGRDWIAFGIAGLAPYWFELQATAYVGAQGRAALRFEAEYELLLTQRLVLQPRAELDAYGKADPARGIGAGLSDGEFGLRLRYEIRREFAPYVGYVWTRRFGASAGLARSAGEPATDRQWVAGVRVWF
ncbi:MAG: copper resistance protein B [Mizugakiibacter sp.]|uniref:copper resistance protein B n=1 Tax=Mizugakiibacter sp. TaxID=1972610 RepID=UPI0031BFAB14|nr:copper resistance protein B [Xanthomonadaceae bacterium]